MDISLFVLKTREHNTILKNKYLLDSLDVNLFTIDNSGNSILKGRIKAIELIETKLVSFIDDDDDLILDKNKIELIINNHNKCTFTNSLINNSKEKYLLNNENQWSLEKENRGFITPHQLFIFDTEIYKELCKETSHFIISNNLNENLFDIVLRLIVSNTIGWKYLNIVCYIWNTKNSFIHNKLKFDINLVRQLIKKRYNTNQIL